MPVEITQAYEHMEDVRALFEEYTSALGLDLSYQNYAEEFAGLPGRYAPPDGGLYVALCGGAAAGCVAFRRFDAERCEMKRLYVRAPLRGLGAGKALAERAIRDARAAGYRFMLLDTLASMESAMKLYQSLGFAEIAPYYETPVEGTRFLRLPL